VTSRRRADEKSSINRDARSVMRSKVGPFAVTQPATSIGGMSLDLDRYSERVGLPRVPSPSEDGLFALHRAQAFAIPFEGFDVLLGREVRLDIPSLMRKLVLARRGGYCFELNGLMLAVLDAAGFQTEPLLARVFFQRTPDEGVLPRTHQVTLVRMGSREWLVDVGFGSASPRLPIPFEVGVEHAVDGERFRLLDHGALGTMVQHLFHDGWKDLYVFTRERAYPADFVMSNHYTSTHPESLFKREPRVGRLLPDGRVTMRGDRVTWTRHGGQSKVPTPRGQELLALLESEFGIALDALPTW
jgi:N-hydroxyarylamine O-acetyltransferase